MSIRPIKFDHDSLMRFKQLPGDITNLGGMGFVPFTDRSLVPPPPPAPPHVLHAPPLGCQTHGPTIDDVRERRQELRCSHHQT